MTNFLSDYGKKICELLIIETKTILEEANLNYFFGKYLDKSEVILIEKMKKFLDKYKKQLINLKIKIKKTKTPNDDLAFNFALRQLKDFSTYVKQVIKEIETS